MKTLITISAAYSLLACCISNATEVLVLGNESMPFCGIVDGKPSGMVVDILTEVTNHGGPSFKYKLGLPWKRAQQMLKKSGASPTAIVPFTRTKEREKSHTWIAEIIPNVTRLSTHKKEKPLTIEKAKQLNIGVILGSAIIPHLKELGFTKLEEVPTAIHNSRKLAVGRIDAIVDSKYVDTYHWKLAGGDVKTLKFTNIGKEMYIYIAGNLNFPPDIAKKINIAVSLIHENGTLKAILNKWDK